MSKKAYLGVEVRTSVLPSISTYKGDSLLN